MAGMDRDGGALFANNKKQSEKAPDYRGELRVTPEVVASLNDQLKRGVQNPAMEIAGWKRVANSGTTFISLSGKKPYEKPQSGNSSYGGGNWPQQGGQQNNKQWGGGFGGGGRGDIDDQIPFSPEWR